MIIVAERLKRLDSIIKKLQRERTDLYKMQDLGGCRFITQTIDEVYEYVERAQKSFKRHERVDFDDYIANPKKTGYRGFHLIYQYHNSKTSDSYSIYNKMRIEIQFRTYLQHIWATAIEIMDIATNTSLKTGQGDDDVKRFFALISSLFAIEEKTNIVPETSDNTHELIKEIEELNKRHNYLDKLSALQLAIRNQPNEDGYNILIFDHETSELNIEFFPKILDAETRYKEIENLNDSTRINAVLVHTSSLNSMRTAYANYFLDIGEFINKVKYYLYNGV